VKYQVDQSFYYPDQYHAFTGGFGWYCKNFNWKTPDPCMCFEPDVGFGNDENHIE